MFSISVIVSPAAILLPPVMLLRLISVLARSLSAPSVIVSTVPSFCQLILSKLISLKFFTDFVKPLQLSSVRVLPVPDALSLRPYRLAFVISAEPLITTSLS